MPRLLVVHHSPTAAVRALTDAVLAGAGDEALSDVEVHVAAALEATADDVLNADGIVLLTPANFGYMSGALKHFFDSTFLQIGGALGDDGQGAPAAGARKAYGLCVHGRYDTTGAVRAVQSIVQALPWRQAAPVLEVMGDVDEAALAAATELGATLGAVVS
ncbi:MAG: flavodoxin family protein [Nocardioides sp.]|uniref:flavodoxin family protein n=1 Tax=Nocardioides sp. TaxID=35761 RepID=UPI003F0F3B29